MTTTEKDVYVTTLSVEDIFADYTYQRELDAPRAKRMAAEWNRRLVGIVEVSDRGTFASPRYAVVDGQHRWAAARLLDPAPMLVVNVHEGLTVDEEAQLFDGLNRNRKQTNTWDHWKARRAAGEDAVLQIERVVLRNKLDVDMSPCDARISCVATLEKVVKLGGLELLDQTLSLIVGMWGDLREGLDAPIIHGIALTLWYLHLDIDLTRLGEAMLTVRPRQLKANANQLKEITSGSGSVRTAIAIMAVYNKTPGRRILVSNNTFVGKRREAGA
jgi:hypothetical protein